MMPVLIYAVITVLLAAVDAVRIRLTWGKVKNINHAISGWLAVATCAAQYFITHPGKPILFVFTCISVRWLIYNVALNLFRGRSIAYQSTTSSSTIDKFVKRLELSFIGARIAAAAATGICLLLWKILVK